MKLNHSQYLVLDEISGVWTAYDDASRLISNLAGRRHRKHLRVIVIGTKGSSFPLEVGDDLITLQKTLITTMRNLI